MNPDSSLPTAEDCESLEHTMLIRHRLEPQFANLDQQHHASALGMWVFLATEVMFFGPLFLAVFVYYHFYPEAFQAASRRLNLAVGGTNSFVLLLSSLTVGLAVYYAWAGCRKRIVACLLLTALLGAAFLLLKGYEYYTDYRANLIPGWRFEAEEWIGPGMLQPDQVPQVKLFLLLYWIMTALHGVHLTIGVCAVSIMVVAAWQGRFSADYYSPVNVTGLYWHFVDMVWIFLLPTLYLLGWRH